MQRFIFFLLTLAALTIGVDFALTRAFDAMYQQTKLGQSGGEINQYLALNMAPSVLLMGNSRARYQVNPDSFALPTYSLCHAGMGQCFQTGLLQVLEQEHKLPTTVLLHVDLAEYAAPESLEDVGTLRYYYNKIPFITSEIDQISQYERIKYLFRFYRYNGRVISQLKNFVLSRQSTTATNGYQPLEPIAVDTTTLFAKKEVGPSERSRFHHANLRHLLKFIDVCQRNNVKVLCFTSPYFIASDFVPVVVPPLDSLLRAHGVPYLNCEAQMLPTLRSHARFWQDNDHINRLGAGFLSQQIAQWSKHYLLAADSSRQGRR